MSISVRLSKPSLFMRISAFTAFAVITLAAGLVLTSTPQASATGSAAITVGATSVRVGQANPLGIALEGFTDAQRDASYQVTLKYVDANDIEQSNGTLAASQSGTSLIAGYASFSANKLGFTGTYAQVAAALASVTWTPSASTSGLRLRIGLSSAPGTNQFYDANSGRYYEYVQGNVSATAAFSAAAKKTLFGLNGYLVHITSRAENDFIANETSASNIWIGATDSGTEGQWRWAGANIPDESDIVFGTYAGTSSTPTATAAGYGLGDWYAGRYAGWASNEPNDTSNEDYAVTNWNNVRGSWNDLGETSGQISGYLVEYGGAGGTSTALSITKDATMGSSDALATWTSPSSPSTSATQTFTLSFNYDITGLLSADIINVGSATNCVFTPAVSSASSGVSLNVVASGCSTGTVQPRLLENSVDVGDGLVIPAATASAITIALGPVNSSSSDAALSATSVAAGSATPIVVTFTPKDTSGRNLGAGASVTIESSLGSVSDVTDNGDGTYSARITVGAVAGTSTVTIKVGGVSAAPALRFSVEAPPSSGATAQQTPPQTRFIPRLPAAIVPPAETETNQSEVTAPNAPNTSNPSLPITLANGELPVALPGQAILIIDGRQQIVNARAVGNETIEITTADGLTFTVTAKSQTGGALPLDENGVLRLTFGQTLELSVDGFAPSSELTVWLFSTPKKLGSVPVDASGSAAAQLALDLNLPPGMHSLQVSGMHPDGSPRSAMLSVFVEEEPVAVPLEASSQDDTLSSGMVLMWVAIGLVPLAGLITVLVVVARRRRS